VSNCNVIHTSLAKDFFSKLIEGYNLNNNIENLIKLIQSRYWAPSTEAVIMCLKVAVRRYLDMKQQYENKLNS
jgi:hypothetical protein